MIEFLIDGDLDPMIFELEEIGNNLDLMPIARAIEVVMTEDNALARAEGIGADGTPLEPLRYGRPLKAWEIRKRGGDGPPLAPRGTGSRVVTDFVTESIPLGEGAILITGRWPGTPFVKYHSDAQPPTVVRDIVGIRPEANARIEEAVRAGLAVIFGGSS